MNKLSKYFYVVLSLLCVISCCSDDDVQNLTNPPINTPSILVSSFNIRFDNPADGNHSWQNRRENVFDFIRLRDLDLIGLQEPLINQLNDLDENLPQYGRVGIGRDDGLEGGEFSSIYYKRNRFEPLDHGDFWLSETPNEPSIGWDAFMNRICSYAVLLDRDANREVAIFNTHFDHVGEQARLQSTLLIRDSIQSQMNQNRRVILTGDLNYQSNSQGYSILNEFMTDSYSSDYTFGPYGTFNGFNLFGNFNRRIDYIFSTSFKPLYYETVSTVIDGIFLSDHFPIVTELSYRPFNTNLN